MECSGSAASRMGQWIFFPTALTRAQVGTQGQTTFFDAVFVQSPEAFFRVRMHRNDATTISTLSVGTILKPKYTEIFRRQTIKLQRGTIFFVKVPIQSNFSVFIMTLLFLNVTQFLTKEKTYNFQIKDFQRSTLSNCEIEAVDN